MKKRINYCQSDFDAAANNLLKNNPALHNSTFEQLMSTMKTLMFELIASKDIDSIATYGFILCKCEDASYIDIDVYVSPRFAS